MTQLTPHFSLEELTFTEHREFDNIPNESEIKNLKRLAQFLEMVKEQLDNKPIMINSGFRSEALNRSLGSKDSSQHRVGCAADLRVPGMTPDEVVKAIIASSLPFDQVIREFCTPTGGGWTHVSVPNDPTGQPRRQALIIDKAGTRLYS